MTGDCHVRICESGGLECSPPLDHKAKKHHHKKKTHGKKSHRAASHNHGGGK
jgi:hypothetical protein